MSVQRHVLGARGFTFAAALLMSTAFTVPAFAQIETIVVTAEKKSEDIQSVPVAVTAFTADDLAADQINSYSDLQFNTPNVSYSKGNFIGANFDIRGVGQLTTSSSADAGVAQHLDDVYIEEGDLSTAEYYDVDRIEILRGPQGTLYGRGAAGGAVNVITAKPDLSQTLFSGEATSGSYDTVRGEGVANIPLIDNELGVRLAGNFDYHSGFTDNIGTDSDVGGQNLYSLRGSVRWQPTSGTTVDFIASVQNEADSHERGDKQMCHTDPSGVLGCLPDELAFGAPNLNSNFTAVLSSQQFLTTLQDAILQNEEAGGLITPVQYAALTGAGGPVQAIAKGLGLFNLQNEPTTIANADPSSLSTVNESTNPHFNQSSQFYTLQINQQVTSWLKATAIAGFNDGSDHSVEGFFMTQDPSLSSTGGNVVQTIAGAQSFFNTLAFPAGSNATGACINNSASLQCSLAQMTAGTPFNPATYAALMASHPGELPLSSTLLDGSISAANGNPANAAGIQEFSPNFTGHDTYEASQHQWTGEVRLASDLNGPLNFLVGGFYEHYRVTNANYYVNVDTIDYVSTYQGALLGNLGAYPPLPPTNGLMASTPFYVNNVAYSEIDTMAGFGEVYYDAIPDTLKFTLGARYTEDNKSTVGYNGLVSFPVAIGTTNPLTGLTQHTDSISSDKLTGRAVVEWTPKLDFTDQTMVYFSASRGYKAGGLNPPLPAGFSTPLLTNGQKCPASASDGCFLPETNNSLEFGVKNTVLGGTVQANLTGWYYDYLNLQSSIVVDRTSINSNISAHMMGLEGEFKWAPDDHWQFNLNLTSSQSSIGDISETDPRNPGAGQANAVVVKDISNGSECVINMPTTGPFAGVTPAQLGVLGFYAPQDPTTGVAPVGAARMAAAVTQDAPFGVPYVNFGVCPSFAVPGVYSAIATNLAALGYVYPNPGVGVNPGNASAGNPVSLKGNEVPNLPRETISIGAQYRWNLSRGYSLVPRVDYYWQSSIFASVFNTQLDRLNSWDVMNVQIQLNTPDNLWFARVFATNIFDKRNPTGEFLTDQSAGSFTNLFLEDPRVVGVTLGAHF